MLRIALKNVLARKGRLLLSSLAVIAGCTFLSGVFVFSDTINGRIDTIFATAYDKTDAYVRSAVKIENDFGDDQRGTISDSLIAEVRAVPGVKAADGDVRGTAVITNPDGDIVGGEGPPQYGAVYAGEASSPWRLKEGRAAANGSEVVIDSSSAKRGDINVGDTVTISSTGEPQPFLVVGLVTFGGSSTGGPTWALFDLDTAEQFVLDSPGSVSSINIVGDGSVTQKELKTNIQQLFDKTQVEVLTGKEIADESRDDLAKQFSFFTLFLTIFAAISIFVSCFVIYNIFKISAAQRLRENALMRAIGARSSQVVFAQFVEAVIVGVLGAILGFAGGVGLATLITTLLEASGNGPGDTSLVIKPSSFAITFIVGVTVTLVCATFPAIRAGRVPPLAAMRDVAVDRSGGSRRRIVFGAIASAAAVLGITLGLTSDAVWLSVGVVGLFMALIAFGPFVVGRLADVLTKPLAKVRGVTGAVAGRNAARSPERTALTAAALGIGLALLVAVSTLAASLQGSLRETFGQAFRGDIAVSPKQVQGGLIPAALAPDVAALPEVGGAVGFGGALFKITNTASGKPRDSGGIQLDPTAVRDLIKLHFDEGSWTSLEGNNILMYRDYAKDHDYTVGSTLDVSFANQSTATFTVAGIFSDDVYGNFFFDRAAFANSGLPDLDFQIVAKAADGVSLDTALAAIDVVLEKYPTAKAQTRTQFIDDQISALDGIITFIYALLFMSVFIAVLGIVLTLLLSVYERRRELGLMRAIGTTRPQIRGSIRWESILTALLGAFLGVGLGVTLGWIVVRALKDQGLNVFAVSIGSVITFGVLSVVFAVIAAWWPARKAAQAPILEAIATT
jgi:putative ABC transport system permease protein